MSPLRKSLRCAWGGLSVMGRLFCCVAVALIITSFILPPLGVIDPSVFGGVWSIFAIVCLLDLPTILEVVGTLKVSIGEAQIEMDAKRNHVSHSNFDE